MNIDFATDAGLEYRNCEICFPEPEVVGFTGGCGNGVDGLFGNHMASIVKLDSSAYRIYLTRRLWTSSKSSQMDIGFVDTQDLANWPDIHSSFRFLKIAGLDCDCSLAQPYVIRHDGIFELFFWIHGSGMIRYVKGVSEDGEHFRILNLDSPCLYHPADKDVRTDSSADGFLSIKENLNENGRVSCRLKNRISNDATTVSYDPISRTYLMYSVLLLDSSQAPERVVSHDNAPSWLRVIHRRTSNDGLEWSEPEIVLIPDQDDRRDLQFYVLQHLRQPGRLCGVAGYYRAEDQELDLGPAVSADGINWLRGHKPWSFRDWLQIDGEPVKMLFPGGMLEVDGWIWMIATAFNFNHNMSGKLKPEQYRQECLVYRQKVSRWAGLKNLGGVGEVVTTPFRYGGIRIKCDDTEKVRVSLLSAFGETLVENGKLTREGIIYFHDKIDHEHYGHWIRIKLYFDTVIYAIGNINTI